MRQPLRILETSPTLLAQADVVVIGGGIIGIFAAYYMARRGLSVAVVEKGRIGAEQSSRNWGWCRQQNPAPFDPARFSRSSWGKVAEF